MEYHKKYTELLVKNYMMKDDWLAAPCLQVGLHRY